MREECTKFAEKLTSLFSDIIFKTMTVQLLRELEELDITLSQLQALTHVGERGKCSIGEIAEGLGVTHPAAVKMVDRLARRELLTRSVSAVDHRQAEIRITPAGRQLVTQVRQERTQRLASVLERMTPDERSAMILGLERFVATALENERALDGICVRCQTLLPTDCVDWHGRPEGTGNDGSFASLGEQAPGARRKAPVKADSIFQMAPDGGTGAGSRPLRGHPTPVDPQLETWRLLSTRRNDE